MGKWEQLGTRANSDKHRAWLAALQNAVDVSLHEPAAPQSSRPGMQVLSASTNGTQFVIELRFVAGEEYCCSEASCFIPTYDREWWARIRASLHDATGRSPPPMSVTILGAIEAGAKLRVNQWLGLPIQNAAEAYTQGPCHENESK